MEKRTHDETKKQILKRDKVFPRILGGPCTNSNTETVSGTFLASGKVRRQRAFPARPRLLGWRCGIGISADDLSPERFSFRISLTPRFSEASVQS
jgi:hypothetical protein